MSATPSADQIINRLRPQLAKVPGATLFLQAAQDLNIGGRTTRTQYQYTLQDSNIDELNDWAPRLLARAAKAADAARRGLRPADRQRHGRRSASTAIRRRASASSRRPSTRRSTTPSASARRRSSSPRPTAITSFSRSPPRCRGPCIAYASLYLKSPLTGQMVPLSAMTKYDTQHVTYLSINHQGQFPAVTLSFNLAPGAALGDAVDAISRASRRPAFARHHHWNFPGHGAGLSELAQDSTVSDSGGAGGRVYHSRHALRELHSSADHSLDAALGGRRRAADAAAVAHRAFGHGADRHHSADRHREEERHHDGGLRHPSRARTASVAARCDPSSLPAAFSAHHDDHHGRAARRAAARCSAAAPAPSCASRWATPWSAV